MGVLMNGYAQLSVREGATYVRIVPPQEGGKKQQINQLTEYLEANNLLDYNIKELAKLCEDSDGVSELKVGPAPFHPYDETMTMDVSEDKMLVFCTFYPPSEGGHVLGVEDVIKHFNQYKIQYGIDEDAIIHFFSNKEYNRDIVLVKGKPPRQGKDGSVKYFFNTSLNTKPKKNPDGTVDYHELNTVSIVQEGQRLAVIIPEDPGEIGVDVYGNEVKPRTVKRPVLQFGNNITLSEDGMEIFSDVTGHATLTNEKVFVSNILDIPADVDTSTGDINYDGSVLIHGNVKSGFKVAAKGDIVIEGVVEGAQIISQGQIVIKQGIHGMNKGMLDARGNILCKFIENAKVISGGYIETEGIMHSKVSANQYITAHGKKAMITGGVVRAGQLIDADTLGSEMGATTLIEVGIEPKKKIYYNELRERIQALKKEIDSIKPVLSSFAEKMSAGVQLSQEKVLMVQKLAHALQDQKKQLGDCQAEFNELHEELMRDNDARVRVMKEAYQGVTITISDVSLTTKDTRSHCQFVRHDGEIQIRNL